MGVDGAGDEPMVDVGAGGFEVIGLAGVSEVAFAGDWNVKGLGD
jgi:hypothetical protein